jgi:hypothetical protein
MASRDNRHSRIESRNAVRDDLDCLDCRIESRNAVRDDLVSARGNRR